MTDREKLMADIAKARCKAWEMGLEGYWTENAVIADHLIANGVTVQKWISASETPKKRGEYLSYIKYEPESPDVIMNNFYYGSGHWLSEMDRVTHWMPLPEPPKEE